MTAAEREQAQTIFLEAFAVSANLTAAAGRAGVPRQRVYEWQEHDEAFSLRYRDAEQRAQDVIRAAIHQRAVVGWQEHLVSMGRIVLDARGEPIMLHRYDSALLHALARARLPEFRERQSVEVSGPGGGPVELAAIVASVERKIARYVEHIGPPDGVPGESDS
jgi:hypothetical protein